MLRIIIIKIVCKILYVYLVIRLYKRIWWVLELSVFSEWDLGTGVEQKLFFTPVCYSKTQFVWFHQCPKNTFFCHCSSILRVCRLDCLDHLDYRLPSKYFCHTTKSGSPELGLQQKIDGVGNGGTRAPTLSCSRPNSRDQTLPCSGLQAKIKDVRAQKFPHTDFFKTLTACK